MNTESNSEENISTLFEILNKNFNYLVLRNIESLTQEDNHDIDILIAHNDTNQINQFLNQLKERFQCRLFKNYRYSCLYSHIILIEEQIIHLDLFTEILWHGRRLLDPARLLEKKQYYQTIPVIDDASLNEYCWLQYHINHGNCKQKYCDKAARFESQLDDSSYKSFHKPNQAVAKSYLKSKGRRVEVPIWNLLYLKLKRVINPYGRCITLQEPHQAPPESILHFKKYCLQGVTVVQSITFSNIIPVWFQMANEKLVIVRESRIRNGIIKRITRKWFLHSNRLQDLVPEAFASYEYIKRSKYSFIAVLGTDGSGKTTVIESVKSIMPELNIIPFHLRPRFLRDLSKIGKPKSETTKIVTNPHGKKPHIFLLSIVQFFYYFFDYTLGFWCKVVPQIIHKNIVVFDRYYYDYYADKKRFRSTLPNWWYRFWELFIPKPQKVFFLDGTTELFRSRKQEVSKKSLEDQIRSFRSLCRNRDNFIVLDASQTPEEIGRDVLSILCEVPK